MYHIIFCIICCLFSSSGWAAYKYELSLCAIFQDEAKYLPEWIEYHHMLGVQRFYLYNNNSRDNYKEVLKPYIKKNLVDLIDWPSPENIDWTPYQMSAYNDCINKTKDVTHWLGVIDIDEFIVPVAADNLQDLLKNYERVGGLQIFWQFFGTSWIKNIPNDMTLIEALTLKAHKNHGRNYNFKTICQPHAVKQFRVHGAEYHHPWFALFPHGTRGGANQSINIDIVRIHHYWTRDEDYFLTQKVPRKERVKASPFTPEGIQKIFQELNQVEDTTILRFVPALKQRLRSQI